MRQSISAAALAATVVSAWDIASPLPSNPSWQPTPSATTLWNPTNGAPIVVPAAAATPPTSVPFVPGVIPSFTPGVVPSAPASLPVIPGMATSTVSVWATVDLTVTACSLPAGACSAPPSTPELPSTPESWSSWVPSAAPSWAPSGASSWMPTATGPSWFPTSILPNCALPSSPLTNQQQVGDSILGTLCQPPLPQWLPDENAETNPLTSANPLSSLNPLGRRADTPPWGDATNTNADATVPSDIPNTGVTRKYDFTVTRGEISPDGAVRQVMMVNNQYPGPMIEANWGDWIEVTVTNNIEYPLEGTSIHWHGFLQRGSNWADGVPSVAQCPIAPSNTHTYRFQAQLYGSSWWHAHYSAQYTAGVVGPIVIHGPTQLPYDIDLGPVMLSDWYHLPYFSLVADAVGTDMALIPPTSDSLLINGRGRYNCSQTPQFADEQTEYDASNVVANTTWSCIEGAALAEFMFTPGKTHRLRLMNVGADGVQKFSIDGHQLTVISYDFVPVTPHTTDVVTLGIGQRADILVTASNYAADKYWMRTAAPGGATCGGSDQGEIQAIVYYEGADTTTEPTTTSSVTDTSCDTLEIGVVQPEYSITPTAADIYHLDLTIALVKNSTGSMEWQLNGQTYRANFNVPLLYEAAEGRTSYPDEPQWHTMNLGNNATIIVNITNATPFYHPFHLHGHNFYVLGEGQAGTVWDGTTVNPTNPLRRDTQMVPQLGWAAIQFENDNPGVWPFHCHVAWHLSGGLAMNFMTQPENIPTIPAGERDSTCLAWDSYSTTNVVDQIDAGS